MSRHCVVGEAELESANDKTIVYSYYYIDDIEEKGKIYINRDAFAEIEKGKTAIDLGDATLYELFSIGRIKVENDYGVLQTAETVINGIVYFFVYGIFSNYLKNGEIPSLIPVHIIKK